MKFTIPPAMAEALRQTRAGNLAEATALIRTALSGGGAPATPPAPAVPDRSVIDLQPERVSVAPKAAAGSRFTEQTYSGAAGSLRYRLYVPAGAAPGMPLLVMLHGCTQSPEDIAAGTAMNRLADERGFVVAYPGQDKAANPQLCWNWFQPRHQQRDGGEPAMIAGITRAVIAAERIDPARVYVAGMSAGGAMAAILAHAYPDLYAAVGIHSGIASGIARDLPGALQAMKNGAAGAAGPADGRFVPVITFHGDRDRTVAEVNSREIVAAATRAQGGALTTRTETGRSAGGRDYTRSIGSDADGRVLIEQWTVHGRGHAWAGGDAAGSYTDPSGPDASRAMLRFFLDHRLAAA